MATYGVHLRDNGITPILDMAAGAATLDSGRITIGNLAHETGVTPRALRFYQSKGLLTPQRDGVSRVFSAQDRDRVNLILQGKRLGFTLCEIREMLAASDRSRDKTLPINRKRCVAQIKFLERQRHDLEQAIVELRGIYTRIFRGSLTDGEVLPRAS